MPSGQQLSSLVQSCVQQSRQSQKEFYKFYYGFAMNVCMRYGDTNNDAVEIVNDGFLKIFKTLALFQPMYENYEASLMAWMKRIMIYTSIDHFRKNKNKYLVSEIENSHYEISEPAETSVDRMSYKEIFELVQKLSPVFRTVFNLYVIDGYKHEEIASQLKISVGTSKSNLYKARINIQKMLKETNITLYEQRRAI